jgi:hypothetical protein
MGSSLRKGNQASSSGTTRRNNPQMVEVDSSRNKQQKEFGFTLRKGQHLRTGEKIITHRRI